MANNTINKEEIEIPFSWTIPESWSVGNPSSMRLATYSASYPKGVADVSITNFSGDGGGILANVNRWRRQLNLEPQSLDEINNLMLSETSGLGEYNYIKIVNYEDQSSAFLCAIIAIKNSTLFIKLNASLEGINYLEQEFVSFCSSFNYSHAVFCPKSLKYMPMKLTYSFPDIPGLLSK